MKSPRRAPGTLRFDHDLVSEALQKLYAAAPEAFVARRRELVAELRVAGELPASRLVAALTKPTRTAWALNQLARSRPELLRAVFDARDVASAAQKSGEFERVQAATRAYRERVADVARASRETLLEAGVTLSTTQARAEARRIGDTLQAAYVDGSSSRERLLSGRLVRNIEVEDPFAGLQVGPPARRKREPPDEPEGALPRPQRAATAQAPEREEQQARRRQREQQERENERRRAIEAARHEVTSREEALRVARSLAEKSRFAAQRAQAEAERAQRDAMEADDGLKRARAHLRALEG